MCIRKARSGFHHAILLGYRVTLRCLPINIHCAAENKLLCPTSEDFDVALRVRQLVTDHVDDTIESSQPAEFVTELLSPRPISGDDPGTGQPFGSFRRAFEKRQLVALRNQCFREGSADVAGAANDKDL